jgi:sorbitol-specific phosphotransferase system component IIBC
MKFIKSLGNIEGTTFYQYQFTKHDPADMVVGDMIWSDGEIVEVYYMCPREYIDEILQRVTNAVIFVEALKKDYII